MAKRTYGRKAQNFNTSEENKVIDSCFGSEYNDAKSEWQKKIERWKKNYEQTDFPLVLTDTNVPKDRTKLKLPKTYFYKEEVLTKLQNKKWNSVVKPKDPQYVTVSKPMKIILDNSRKEEGFEKTKNSAIALSVLYGPAYLKECLIHEKREIKEIDDEKLLAKAQEEGVSVFDIMDKPYKKKTLERWYHKTVLKTPYQIIKYPGVGIVDAPRLWERNVYSISRFHELFDAYYPKAKYVTGGGDTTEHEPKDSDNVGQRTNMENKVEVLEIWDRESDLFLVVAACEGFNGVLLTPPDNPIPFRHKELPHNWGGIPYIELAYTSIDPVNDTYAKGLPEIVEYPVEEYNTQRRLRWDWIKRILKSKFIANDSMITEEDLDNSEDGNVIWVNTRLPDTSLDMAIKELPVSNIKQEAFIEGDKLEVELLDLIGLRDMSGNPYVSGTGASLASQKVISRHQKTLDDWAAEFRRLDAMRTENIIQFDGKEPEKVLDAIGEDELKRLLEEQGFNPDERAKWVKKGILEVDNSSDNPEDVRVKYKLNLYRNIPYENEKGEPSFEILSPDVLKGKYIYEGSFEEIENKDMKDQKTRGMVQEIGALIQIFPELQDKFNPYKISRMVVEANGRNIEEIERDDSTDVAGEAEALREEDKFRMGKIEPADRQAGRVHIAVHDRQYAETLQILQSKYPENVEVYLKHIADEKAIEEKNSGKAPQAMQNPLLTNPAQAQQQGGAPGGRPPMPAQQQGVQETFQGSNAAMAPMAQMAEQGGQIIA